MKFHEYQLIKDLWKNTNKYFPESLNLSVLEKIFMSIIIFIRSLSLVHIKDLFKNSRIKSEISEFYVVFWLFILTLIWINFDFLNTWIVIIVTYRLIDGINYRIAIVFVNRYQQNWGLRSLNRTIILLILNLFEIVLIFAILYQITGSISKQGEILKQPIDSLYFSFVTITTLGYGEWTPINNIGELLVVAQLITAFIFIGLVLSIFMTGFNDINEIRDKYK